MAVRAGWHLPITVSDGNTREDMRLSQQVMMSPATAITAASGIRPGAISGSAPFDLQSVSAMVCKITAGVVYIQGTTAQGAYGVVNTTDRNLTFSDGHATNPRIDLVVLRIWDNYIDGLAQTVADIVVVPGTAASSPVAPAVPAASIALWEVRVNAAVSAGTGGIASNPGWTSARTDRRVYTVASGGIRPATGGWSGSYDGQYRDAGAGPERWYTATSTWNAPGPLGYVASAYSDTETLGLFAGQTWRINEVSNGLTIQWSASRRYLIEMSATMGSSSGAPNAGWLQMRYKTGPTIPNDGNPASSTLLRQRPTSHAADHYPLYSAIARVHEPSVTEQGTIAMFYAHDGAGAVKLSYGRILVQDLGPR